MGARLCFVALEHRVDRYFHDLVAGIRYHCQDADISWYYSGPGEAVDSYDLPRLPTSRPLEYAKVTPFFFDMFEWAVSQGYDYVVNVESDMAFICPGFEDFLGGWMRDADYLAPGFQRAVPRTSRWRPYRSLRQELPELRSLLGVEHVNRCFSPGQVFSARYIERLLASPFYVHLRSFVERNQAPGRSYTLQEVLLPTLPDVLGLVVVDYPPPMATWNRYRPYHSRGSVERALAQGGIYFVHPVRRDDRHPARQLVRDLLGSKETTGPAHRPSETAVGR